MDAGSTLSRYSDRDGQANDANNDGDRSSSRLSQSSGRSSTDSGNIKVIARFRPMLDNESGSESVVSITSDTTVLVNSGQQPQQFVFDKVFGASSTQQELFEYSVKPIVEDVLRGYNGTVLAYGQTGAGKSHTMMGTRGPERGAIPRMIELIFAEIESAPDPSEYEVEVSYLEIYNEKVKDLIDPSNGNGDLRVHEAFAPVPGAGASSGLASGSSSGPGASGFYVKGLTQVPASHTAQVLDLMSRGDRNRSTATTNMNHASSRSHSIFAVNITQRCGLRGRLFLVDLAGNEKASKTGASGQLLEEASNINKSLSILGLVINNLASRQQRGSQVSHIPYRNSNLTRILQESLGGSSRTCMIINCSPAVVHLNETLSSLRFGMRARYVRNDVRVNMTADASGTLFLQTIISELLAWRSGERPPKEDWIELPRTVPSSLDQFRHVAMAAPSHHPYDGRHNRQTQESTSGGSRPSSRCGFIASSTTHTSLTQARASRPLSTGTLAFNSLTAELEEVRERYRLMELKNDQQIKLKDAEIARQQASLNEEQNARLEAEKLAATLETEHNAAKDTLGRHVEHLRQENRALKKQNQKLIRMRKVERRIVSDYVEQLASLREQIATKNAVADFDHAYVEEAYMRLEPVINDMVSGSQ